MAAIRGLPVSLTQVSEATYATQHPNLRPQKLVIVGDVPDSTPATPVALPAVPGSFADEAAVQTYLASLVTALKSSDLFN